MTDSARLYRSFIRRNGSVSEITLRLEGIRCVNCINAIEKRLNTLSGITAAQLNLTRQTARLDWDEAVTPLDQILGQIKAAGFGFTPLRTSVTEECNEAEHKDSIRRLVTAIFFTMNLMLISVSLWAGFFTGMEERFTLLFQRLSMVLAAPVIFYAGWGFIRGAYFAVKNRSLNMDFQVAFNSLLIYVYSIYAGFTGNGETYFESAAMFVTFILLSKYFESAALQRMQTGIKSLHFKIPRFGRLCTDDGITTIAPEDIRPGHELELLPGDAVPADGTVLSGHAGVDESSLSGEYLPVIKTVGERVFSGTFVQDGSLRFRVDKAAAASTLNRLADILRTAMADKPAVYRGLLFFERQFTNIVAVLAVLTFVGRYYFSGDINAAILNAVAVFIIACPCALALAVPLSYVSGFRLAAGKKMILTSSKNFEAAAAVTDIVFDKTGTLTQGKPEITAAFGSIDPVLERKLFALAAKSNHILSKTIAAALKNQAAAVSVSSPEAVTDLQEVPGKGIRGNVGTTGLVLGSVPYIEALGVTIPRDFKAFIATHSRATPVCFVYDNTLCRIFILQDALRPEAVSVCQALQAAGIHLHLCSGDRKEGVRYFAEKTGVFGANVHSEMTPEAKRDLITAMQAKGSRVLFVGDGLNDAPALVQADLGIAMNGGIELAIENADVILLENNLSTLTGLMPLAHAVKRLIRQNIRMSSAYNLIAVSLAVAGYVTPMAAALSMSLSSLLTVGNSLRLKMPNPLQVKEH